MKRILLIATLLASPAVAQQEVEGQLPSEGACGAVLDRVQLALAQADRSLQAENTADVESWSAIAAHYATIHEAFCADAATE